MFEQMEENLEDQVPLEEGVLKINFGIPIVVACHKVDLITHGEKAQYLEKNIDFIQKHLREYCLYYGASLVFTDIHQQTNLELLYRYLLHRLYDQEFSQKAQFTEKSSIFIPSGFDSLNVISQLCSGTAQADKRFDEVI